MSRTASSRPARATALVAVVAVLALSGCSRATSGAGQAAGSTTGVPTTGTTAPASVTPSASTSPTGPAGPTSVAPGEKVPAQGAVASVAVGLRPARLTIASIGVSTPLGDLGVAGDGTVEVPTNPSEAGWFDRGPAPGQQGPAVVLGHVDSTTGPAVFARLGELHPGDPVVVTRRDGSGVTFTVDAVQTVAKDRFPTAETYGPVPGPALRLITCGGSYDHSRGGYQANVIVFAS